MKLIMEELVERVYDGEKFHIDLEKRNMKVGNDYLIRDGEYDKSKYQISDNSHIELNTVLFAIETFYNDYKYSIPSERSEGKRRKYFKALPIEELTDEQLVVGMPREVAQCALEGYMMCYILDGSLYWDEQLMGKWFWQSKNDNDLVILKKWIKK